MNTPMGTYRMEVMSLPEECDFEAQLPREIQYIFKAAPDSKEKIRTILSQGKAIGVRTVLRTPEHILKAVHIISVHSQKNYILSWLPQLLRDHTFPKITKDDRVSASAHDENLDQAIDHISRDRLQFKKFVLIDEENRGIAPHEQALITELSELLYPIAIDYAVFRVTADNARERTHIAQGIIKALVIIGPVAHILEKYISGLGKLFAASADDLLGEAAELSALRGSGFSWRELSKRLFVLVPVFALATYGAFSVEHLLEEGRILLAGAIFGLSAVALSLTTAIQSLGMYRDNARVLRDEGKLEDRDAAHITKLALIQDFTNPVRLGLLIGVSCAPLMGMLGAITGVMHNGWILAAIGSTESILAGITVIFADHINEWRFARRLRRLIR